MCKKIKSTLKNLKEQNRKPFGLFNHITKAWIKRKQKLVFSINKQNTWNTCNLGKSIRNKTEKFSKIKQDKKSFIPTLHIF